jgi:hypothetical protein
MQDLHFANDDDYCMTTLPKMVMMVTHPKIMMT